MRLIDPNGIVSTMVLLTDPGNSQAWLGALNPQQREAVTYGDGPILVVAGAGSGKTRTLAYRVAYLISEGVQPQRIVLLTFTRRAAEEMLRRASGVMTTGGSPAIGQVWGGTFHAFGNRILRMFSQAAGLPSDFTILDQTDTEDLLDVIRNDLGFSKKDRRFPRKGTCQAIYSRRVNGDEDLDSVLKEDYPWCAMWKEELKALFREYVSRKQRQNILDYDDLLLYLYHLLQNHELASAVGRLFDHVLVDEYQDTNRLQGGILMGLRRETRNIMVVGDDAQSIYGFRSATVRNILDFPQQFPGTRIVTLEQNYRSTQPILDTTNRIITQARDRYSKDLWSERAGTGRPQLITCIDENQQDDEVIRRVLDHYEQGISLRRQAVLFRATSHSNSLEVALARRNIPFHKYGGLKFLETAHIKDLVCFLRVLENPRDEIAWFRIAQLLNGVGPATAASLVDHLRGNLFVLSSIATFKAPGPVQAEITRLGSLFCDLADLGDRKPEVQIERISTFYQPLLERNYDNPQPRSNDIQHLGALASGYESRRRFLADLILDPPSSTGDLAGPPSRDDDWLVLSTIHSAKGLEWDAVYLIHAADGCLPSDMATGKERQIEGELRLT